MVDLLSHVLVGYSACALLARRGCIGDRHVPVGTVGSALPDLAKVQLLVSPGAVGALLGTPFSWLALHRLGGVLALAGIGALLFERGERRTVFGLLVGGGLGELFLDVFVTRAGGYAPPYLYPFSWWQPPAGNLYVSSDLWPLVVAAALALATFVYVRRDAATAADRR
ncbi:MAG: metal-dependent hydrolase [Salinigranum sp.]